MVVRIDLNSSLDGFVTTTDQTPELPFGEDWGLITAAYAATETFRTRVLHLPPGGGTTGVDERYAAEYFREVGAEIMGAGMFGLHLHADDPDWQGWWGDEPPFHCPVYVLTHTQREPLRFENGTVFEFLSASPRDVLDLALAAADGTDVRVGGGASVAREFLAAGLVDRLHVAIAPVVLGSGAGGGGIRLWDDLRRLESGYEVTVETAESGTTHVTFTR